MLKNKCSFHSLKFVILFYKLKNPGLTWTSLVQLLPCKLNHKLHMLNTYELPEDDQQLRPKHVKELTFRNRASYI